MAENLNRIILTGNLTQDPELRQFESGSAVCKLRLAVNTRRKSGDEWEDKPNFFTVTVWGRRGEAVAEHLSKGSPIAVDGRLEWHEWQVDGGPRREAVEIVADSIQFLGGRRSGDEAEAEGASEEDEIPF